MNIYNANYRCYFVDETEIIKEINVPYHCTEKYTILIIIYYYIYMTYCLIFIKSLISGSNNTVSQDLYAFKTFKSLCKSGNLDDEKLCEEVVKLVQNLTTDKVQQQVFDYIITSKHMTQNAIIEFLKSFQTVLKEKSTDNKCYDLNVIVY